MADLVGVIEAAYRVDLAERPWLAGLVEAARPLLDDGHGVFACLHDTVDPTRYRVHSLVGSGIVVTGWARLFSLAIRRMDPAHLSAALDGPTCATVSETIGEAFLRDNVFVRQVARAGVLDGLSIRGVDPSGRGVQLCVPRRTMGPTPPESFEVWSRIAAHLASGLRLRMQVGAYGSPTSDGRGAVPDPASRLDRAAAVLEPGGRIAHATGEAATPEGQVALRAAAIAFDRARGRLRRADPLEAVSSWTALCDGRWTVLDHFDRDGRRFVVAERNEVTGPPIAGLSDRERQVLGYVAMGHSNKLIAYHLGLSPSTVASHVAAILAKMGAASRVDLIRRVHAERRAAATAAAVGADR